MVFPGNPAFFCGMLQKRIFKTATAEARHKKNVHAFLRRRLIVVPIFFFGYREVGYVFSGFEAKPWRTGGSVRRVISICLLAALCIASLTEVCARIIV